MRLFAGIFLVFLLVTHLDGYAQAVDTSLSFKGAVLGMSLSDFKVLDVTSVWLKAKDIGVKSKDKEVEFVTPACTDTYRFDALLRVFRVIGVAEPRDGEVICFTASGNDSIYASYGDLSVRHGINSDARYLAGKYARNLYYRFYRGKLYEINMQFSSIDAVDIAESFKQKYGTPTDIGYEEFQNGFGAKWKAPVYRWQNGSRQLSLHIGSGLGPGRDVDDNDLSAYVVYLDTELSGLLPLEKKVVDF